jgi:uncharacterized membrane protein
MIKKDKGFELVYANLSDRRKFIRTLWLVPIAITFLILFLLLKTNKIYVLFYIIVSSLVFFHQLRTTYINWKNPQEPQNHERNIG